jgi:rhodanese-related sulfurtransferase
MYIRGFAGVLGEQVMPTDTIPPADVQLAIAAGQPMRFIDVRTPAEFQQVHAVGARLVPLDGLDPAAIAAGRLHPTDPIYVICQSGARAGKAVDRFKQAGIANVLSVEGGTAAWEKLGLPVERGGGGTISLERQVRIFAGSLVFVGTLLGWFVHRDFFVIPAFIGAGLTFAGISNTCGMGMLLAKMPWNRFPAGGTR